MGSGIAPPAAMLRGSAEVVHADLLLRLRRGLQGSFQPDSDPCPERIAGYIEDGLALLASLGDETGLVMDRMETCRLLAETDARFRFIYRLPSSAGWGAAIGGAVERALYGETCTAVRTVTSLLNVFMTFLDGLLDEAPDVIDAYREPLLEFVRTEREGENAGGHPYSAMCFLIARLWVKRLHRLNGSGRAYGLRREFLRAAGQAMAAEYSACGASFDKVPPPSADALYGRTCWPLWTQALAVMYRHKRPTNFTAFRKLIFRIGEFAAYLDDMRDYIEDCMAGRWNTISLMFYSHRPFPVGQYEDVQRRLLASLAEDDLAALTMRTGLELRNSIEKLLLRLPDADPDVLRPLLADMTYEYLG